LTEISCGDSPWAPAAHTMVQIASTESRRDMRTRLNHCTPLLATRNRVHKIQPKFTIPARIRHPVCNTKSAPAAMPAFLIPAVLSGSSAFICGHTFFNDNHLHTKKLAHGKDASPNSRDDEGCAAILQVTDPKDLQNYFRYDATSRDYYRAIATFEKIQAARRRNRAATERTNPLPTQEHTHELLEPRQATANTPFDSIGFVSYF
jgi:hypothetical protein